MSKQNVLNAIEIPVYDIIDRNLLPYMERRELLNRDIISIDRSKPVYIEEDDIIVYPAYDEKGHLIAAEYTDEALKALPLISRYQMLKLPEAEKEKIERLRRLQDSVYDLAIHVVGDFALDSPVRAGDPSSPKIKDLLEYLYPRYEDDLIMHSNYLISDAKERGIRLRNIGKREYTMPRFIDVNKPRPPKFYVGDKVLYQGTIWEVGFANKQHKKGTYRLQKSPTEHATMVNYVYPDELKLLPKDTPITERTWEKKEKLIPEKAGQMTLFGVEKESFDIDVEKALRILPDKKLTYKQLYDIAKTNGLMYGAVEYAYQNRAEQRLLNSPFAIQHEIDRLIAENEAIHSARRDIMYSPKYRKSARYGHAENKLDWNAQRIKKLKELQKKAKPEQMTLFGVRQKPPKNAQEAVSRALDMKYHKPVYAYAIYDVDQTVKEWRLDTKAPTSYLIRYTILPDGLVTEEKKEPFRNTVTWREVPKTFYAKQAELMKTGPAAFRLEIEDVATSDDPLTACLERKGFKPSEVAKMQMSIASKLTPDMFNLKQELTPKEKSFQSFIDQCLESMRIGKRAVSDSLFGIFRKRSII